MDYGKGDPVTLDKERLLTDLKTQIGSVEIENNHLLMYQIGRNSVASYFFIAISSGEYDNPENKD